MATALVHRGPDDAGYFEHRSADGLRVGLAHRRLSIIDLGGGHQPLGNENGRVQLVFNGEIYNFVALRAQLRALGHVFRTESDTEVIVHAYEEWGADCVSRLRGMFAFALFDLDQRRLLLARDRYGKKPLFLLQRGNTLFFASEIKALLSVPGAERRVDLRALKRLLLFRYAPAPRTLFAGIRKLQPGCVAVWENGELVRRRYYRPPDHQQRAARPPQGNPVGAFLSHLDECVRIRMNADVPFGAFLSGGIDSSAIVALMAGHSPQAIRTYSVGFAEAAYSELASARVIADQFHTHHHELTVTREQLVDQLPVVTRYRDAPVAEPSDVPIHLLAVAARRDVKMVLTGEGADELLGGYPKHVFERWAPALQTLPPRLRQHGLEPLVRSLPYGARRLKTAVLTMGVAEWVQRMPRWFGAVSGAEELVSMIDPGPDDDVPAEEEYWLTQGDPGNSALRAILHFDQSSWLPDNLLERGDRMTMGASIEARMPFMDHELAEFVSTLPDEWRVQGRQTKRILRLAMQQLLPAHILERPKVGFRVPVNEWFRGPMREYLGDLLLGPSSLTRDYFRQPLVEQYFREHTDGRQNHEKLLWMLLSLEIWHREYGVRA